ncbi:MAG: SDR family NAD(P)-dependent oxidoreductase [Oscillospiraceae bacterium]|nr:SDR family NAD(P)-dependent oxidoreductase [Oscillospiraceae bacterium]
MRFGRGEGHIAVITGASSGIGAAIARELVRRQTFDILSGRNEEALDKLAAELGAESCAVIPADLSTAEGCRQLFESSLAYSPDVLINNAGYGIYGRFDETDADKETGLVDLNVRAMHILFKLYGDEFERNGRGYILNTASLAGFMPGPLMASYYASKAYVLRLTQAVWLEKLFTGSKVKVSVLCPGPVDTKFNETAGITGFFKGITAEECAKAAIDGMEHGLPMILPSAVVKAVAVMSAVTPALVAGTFAYLAQKGKKRI